MKLRAKYQLSIIVFFLALMVASCTAPAYKQNKYKRAKRYNGACGCMNVEKPDNYLLTLNE